GQPSLQREFQNSQEYIMKPCVKTQPTNSVGLEWLLYVLASWSTNLLCQCHVAFHAIPSAWSRVLASGTTVLHQCFSEIKCCS
ncbi:mCG49110, partial [Mus musculus]